MSILEAMKDRLVSGLRFQSIRSCAEYSSKFRIMGKPFPGPYSTIHHPWCKDMLDWNQDWVGLKCAQVGYTEAALNRVFYTIDMLKTDVLYVLPKQTPDATDFSSARFSPALELSAHLNNLFSDNNNIGHKRAGANNLYVRGAQARSGLKSIPAGLIVFDELDEMPEENVTLGEQRTSGQLVSQIIKISTPSIPEFGISKAYDETTKEHFFFQCPCCSKMTELVFPDCLVMTAETITDPRLTESRYICKECKGILPHQTKIDWLNAKNEWVSSVEGSRQVRGFHVNRMYSMAGSGSPEVVAKEFLKSKTSPLKEQEFFNSVLGKAHVVAGARITAEVIAPLIRGYRRADVHPQNGATRVMGIDVGSWNHYEIGEYYLEDGFSTDINVRSKYRLLTQGKVAHFEQLDPLMRQFQIMMAVIDAHPEKRKAIEFSARFPGHVYLCFYGNNVKGSVCKVNEDARTITVDRTAWLDMSFSRFYNNRIELPLDTEQEYKQHCSNMIRKPMLDANGNPTATYITVGGEDHYAHSRNYAEIALPLAASLATSQDIATFL